MGRSAEHSAPRGVRGEGSGGDVIDVVVRTQCDALGLESPPGAVHARFLGAPETLPCTIVVWMAGADSGFLATWLAQLGVVADRDCDVHGAVARARFLDLDPPWDRLREEHGLIALHAKTSGEVTLHLRGPRAVQRSLIDALSSNGAHAQVEALTNVATTHDPGLAHDLLTEGQHRLLQLAFDAGYYEVPRETNLRDLADKADLSASAFSERLRRAEGAVVARYLKQHPEGDRADRNERRPAAR